jgi:tetratricopeptide (TPR) repeat protein
MKKKSESQISGHREEFRRSTTTRLEVCEAKINERIDRVEDFKNELKEFYNQNNRDEKELLEKVSMFVDKLTHIREEKVSPFLKENECDSVYPNPEHIESVEKIMPHFEDASDRKVRRVIKALSESCDVEIPDCLERRLNDAGVGLLEIQKLLESDKEIISRRLEQNSKLRHKFSGSKELVKYVDEEKNLLEQYEFRRSEILNFANFLERISKPDELSHSKKALKFIYVAERERLWNELMTNTKNIGSELPDLALSETQKVSPPGKNLRKTAAGVGAGGLVGLAAGLTGHLDPLASATIFATGTGTAVKLLVDSYILNASQFDVDSLLQKASEVLKTASKARLDWNATRLYTKAIKFANEIIRLNPEELEAFNIKGIAQTNLGSLLKDTDRFDDALESFDTVIESHEDPLVLYNKAKALCSKAAFEDRENCLQQAESVIGRAIELDTKNSKFYELKGDIHQQLKDLDQALVSYESAIDLGGETKLLFWEKFHDRGYENITDTKNNPPYIAKHLHGKKAAVLWKQGKLEDAKEVLEDAFKWKDKALENVLSLRKKGDKLFNEGKFTKALKIYEEAVNIVPDPALHEKLANTKYKLCDFEGAIDELKAAVSIYPDYITKDKFVFGNSDLTQALIENDSKFMLNWVYSNTKSVRSLLIDRAKSRLGEDEAKAFDDKLENFVSQKSKEYNIDKNKVDLEVYVTNLTEDEFPDAENFIGSISNELSSFVKNLYANNRRLTDSIVGFTYSKAHRWYRQLNDSEELWAAFLPGAVTVPLTIATPIVALSGKPDVLLGITIPNILGWYASAYLANRAINLGCKHELEQEKEELSELFDYVAISDGSIKPREKEIESADEFECPLCGAMANGTDVKCPECGAEFEKAEEEEEEAEEEESPIPSPAPTPSYAPGLETSVKPLSKVKCGACEEIMPIYSTERPLRVECPGCHKRGTLKSPTTTVKSDNTALDRLRERYDIKDEPTAPASPSTQSVPGPSNPDAQVAVPPAGMQPGRIRLDVDTEIRKRYERRVDNWKSEGFDTSSLEALLADGEDLKTVKFEFDVARRKIYRAKDIEVELLLYTKILSPQTVEALKQDLKSLKVTDVESYITQLKEWKASGSGTLAPEYAAEVQQQAENSSDESLDELIKEISKDLEPNHVTPQVPVSVTKKVVRKYVKKYLRVDIPQNVEGHAKKIGDEIYAKVAIASGDTWYKINSQGQIVNESGELVEEGRSVGISLGNRDSLKKFYEQARNFVAKELSDLVWVPIPESAEPSTVKERVSELEVPEPVAASPLQRTLKDSTRNQLPENVELTAPYALPDNVELAKPEVTRDGRAALDEYAPGSDQLVAKLAARQLLYDFNCGRWGELYLNDLKVECGKLEGNINTVLAESKAQELAKKWGQDFIKREKLSGTYTNICVSLFVEYGVTAVKSLSDIKNIKSLQPNRYLSADRIQELLHNPPMQIIDLEQEVLRK